MYQSFVLVLFILYPAENYFLKNKISLTLTNGKAMKLCFVGENRNAVDICLRYAVCMHGHNIKKAALFDDMRNLRQAIKRRIYIYI